MKKTIKHALSVCLILLSLTLIFASCNEETTAPETQTEAPSGETTAAPEQTGEETTAPEATTDGETDAPEATTEAETDADTEPHTHAYGEWAVVKEPTCTEAGEKQRSCSCGHKETETVAATGHTEVTDAAVSATCTAAGKTEGKHCSVCNAVIVAQTTVKATGHKYTAIVTPPTKTEDGYTTYTCKCGDSYVADKVPATGSVGLEYSVNSDGKTCTVTGMGTCTDTEVIVAEIVDGYTVTAIGDKAFADQTSVISIVIPDTVKTIGTRAFYNTGITEFTVPASVTSIGTQIFYKAESLKTVYYNSTYADSSNQFLSTPSIKKIVFGGETVPSVLRENTTVTSVEIKDGVKSIGRYAFQNCTSLANITIPDGVTSIGDCAFSGCTSIVSIAIPASVMNIGSSAFYGCASITSVYITDIEKWCIISFHSNELGHFSSSNPMNNGAGLYLNGNLVTDLIIPDSVTSIGNGTFAGCTLKSITIPDSVMNIGEGAFSGCKSLTSVTIPNSVTSIGDYAFCECTSLTSITIPDSVTNIGGRAFQSCTSLTSITIPDSVTNIGGGVFYGCKSLTSITMPDSVTIIGGGAFWECMSLTSITIPDSVTSIGDYAFYWCASLTSINYSGTIDQWNAIDKGYNWNYNTGDYVIHCTDGDIAK